VAEAPSTLTAAAAQVPGLAPVLASSSEQVPVSPLTMVAAASAVRRPRPILATAEAAVMLVAAQAWASRPVS
jgi:hypothetical protein